MEANRCEAQAKHDGHGNPCCNEGRGPGFLKADQVTEEMISKVRKLNDIAAARGQSLAQMALAWVLRDPRVTSALIGASRVEQLDENVAALNSPAFSAEELAAIDAVL